MPNFTKNHHKCQKTSDGPAKEVFEQLCLPIPGLSTDCTNQKEKTNVSKRPIELVAEMSCTTRRAGQLIGVCADTLRKARKKSKVYVHNNWKAEYLGRNSWRVWLGTSSFLPQKNQADMKLI